jgi:hypothetical protein
LQKETQQIFDLNVIKDTNAWPNVVLAMVKRAPTGMPQCAFLVAECGSKLYVKNLFELEDGPLMPQLETVEIIEFDSFEAMLEDGWEVD